MCGDSNQGGKQERKSNLALYQLGLSLGTQFGMVMLFCCVIMGPADLAPKPSSLLVFGPDVSVNRLLGKVGEEYPAHFYLLGPGGRTKCNITFISPFRLTVPKSFESACRSGENETVLAFCYLNASPSKQTH
jgi:hypothetical protein